LAAGGVTSARGLAAVLAAGAAGAWLGTPFLACPQSLATEAMRRLVVEAGSEDTVCTGVFDAALEYPWPRRFDERVLRNGLTDRWGGAEDDLLADPAIRATLATAIERAHPSPAVVDAGQGVGMVTVVRDAGEVIEDLVSGAAALLARCASLIDPST
jgi:nitronate monooxygenase